MDFNYLILFLARKIKYVEKNQIKLQFHFNQFFVFYIWIQDILLKSIYNNESKNKLPIKDSMEENSISNFNEEVQEERNQKEISSITKPSIIKETLSSSDSSVEEIFPTESYQVNFFNQKKRKGTKDDF